jgi:NADPH:quinone reductase-like Zn-dependent oxidoreductase
MEGTIKQVVITKAGGVGVLKVCERAKYAVGPGEVSIQVKAAGINFADIMARQGLYPDAPKLPCVVGYEVAGIVESVGEGVTRVEAGQRVMALTRFGGYSEQISVPEIQVIPLPESISFEEAATLPVAFCTAFQLVQMGGLRKGESILIHNVGGSVGLALLDIAKHIGAITFGTASGGKHPYLKDRGLDHAIDYRKEDWTTVLNELTKGKGVDLITDPLGGNESRKCYNALRTTGRLGMFGMSTATESGLSGKLRLLATAMKIPLFHPLGLMNQNKGVFGVNMGHMWHEPEKVLENLEATLKGYQAGWVRVALDKCFSFEEAGRAHEYIEDRRNRGKVVLIP